MKFVVTVKGRNRIKYKTQLNSKQSETSKSDVNIGKLSIQNDDNQIESKENRILQTINPSNAAELSSNIPSDSRKESNQNCIINELKDKDDEEIDINELNTIPYTKALKVDNRSFFKIFLSVLFNEIKIISIFYYKSPYEHFSIILSKYIFELCLDLTLNCLLYTEEVISEKYNNNGSIEFLTTLTLSFMSNIISSFITYFITKLAQYVEFLENIINEVKIKPYYFMNIIRFKKLLSINLGLFFFVELIINLGMCYYLIIFCSLYHKTQRSIMINYVTGFIESFIISVGITLVTSLLRFIGIKYRIKHIYYTSRYLFENF